MWKWICILDGVRPHVTELPGHEAPWFTIVQTDRMRIRRRGGRRENGPDPVCSRCDRWCLHQVEAYELPVVVRVCRHARKDGARDALGSIWGFVRGDPSAFDHSRQAMRRVGVIGNDILDEPSLQFRPVSVGSRTRTWSRYPCSKDRRQHFLQCLAGFDALDDRITIAESLSSRNKISRIRKVPGH